MEWTSDATEVAGLYRIRMADGSREFPRPSFLEKDHGMRGVHERSALPVDELGFTIPEVVTGKPSKGKKKKSRAYGVRDHSQSPLHEDHHDDKPTPEFDDDQKVE